MGTVKHSSLHPAREHRGWRGADRRLRCEPPLGAGTHALLREISVLQRSEMNQRRVDAVSESHACVSSGFEVWRGPTFASGSTLQHARCGSEADIGVSVGIVRLWNETLIA